ncbi:hypothetical protein BJ878DRAFT_26778 [Calycina marina]|uniref:DUF7053 domain-containing protein n=1 Tax=Calycina marina TaxID=1763456 RepID=A0A9P7ZAI0_9HELO|nr:hypothetical protein BJ878DRAFT_26778 [Calycina marina]
MSKRSVFTTITPLPPGITRETVMEMLRSHTEMIDLNPLVEERHPIKPPSNATPEEFQCLWYQITDRISYLPGGMISGKVSYNACFHNLEWGLQTHCYAPMGLNIKSKWTLGGSLPGELIAPVELGVGAPLQGLFLREDVDLKCNIMMTSFVKKTTKKAHSGLIDRLLMKASISNARATNEQMKLKLDPSVGHFCFNDSQASTDYSPSVYPDTPLDGTETASHGTDRSNTNTTHDTSLYPQPLSTRGSFPSVYDSTQHRGDGDDSHVDNRSSWQNLRQSSTTSQQQPVTYRSPAQHQQPFQPLPHNRSPSQSSQPNNVPSQLQPGRQIDYRATGDRDQEYSMGGSNRATPPRFHAELA